MSRKGRICDDCNNSEALLGQIHRVPKISQKRYALRWDLKGNRNHIALSGDSSRHREGTAKEKRAWPLKRLLDSRGGLTGMHL